MRASSSAKAAFRTYASSGGAYAFNGRVKAIAAVPLQKPDPPRVFTGSWSTITLSGGNDTGVSNGNCYRNTNGNGYADSNGVDEDVNHPHAWRYRDYVVKSFNIDKPYDRFVKEQIAGDELYPNDPAALIATLGSSAHFRNSLAWRRPTRRP